MKKHILFFIALATIAFSMTSCLKDNDDTNQQIPELTPDQKRDCLLEVAGGYSGKLFCTNQYFSTSDSVECNWSVQDSTLTIQIPKKLVIYAAATTSNKLVTEDNSGAEQKFTLYPQYTEENGTVFYMIPKTEKLSFEAIINEKTSKVEMSYANYLTSVYNYIQPLCQFTKKDKAFLGNILVNGVSINGGSRSASTLMVLKGKKD